MILALAVGVAQLVQVNRDAIADKARTQPDTVRNAIYLAYSANEISRARAFAEGYQRAWSDSFFIRQVARFEKLSAAGRSAFVAADTLRKAGNVAMSREGIPAAMRLWRMSLMRSGSINEASIQAPTLVAIGAGFFRTGELDSATVYVSKAYEMALRIRDYRTVGNALGILASIRKEHGSFGAATELYRRASLVRNRSGDSRGLAADENNLALIAEARGDYKAATAAYQRALTLNRREGRLSLVALNLGNLASIANNLADYSRSDSLYREAIALNRSNGDRAETAFQLEGLGKVLTNRGEYREAMTVLTEALRNHDSSGATIEAIETRTSIAALESAMGNPEAAINTLGEASRAAALTKAPPEKRGALALARGDLALQFGTFPDAEAEYANAERYYRAAGDSSGIAQAINGRALLLHWRGHDAAALPLLAQAARIQETIGDNRAAALTRLAIADVQLDRGEITASRRTLLSARETLSRIGDVVGVATAIGSLAEVSYQEGAPGQAIALYGEALRRLGGRSASELSWRLHTGRAQALRAKGFLSEAANEFRVAIDAAEKSASALRLEERRSGFLADKWTAYTQLALLEQARGRTGEAFLVSERMRARQMLDLMSRGRVTMMTSTSKREQDLRARVAVLTSRLESREPFQPGVRESRLSPEAADATRSELDSAQKEYARLMVRIRESDPGQARLVSAEPRAWRDVASRLKSDEVLLEYLLTDSASSVFVVSRDTIAAIDLHVTRQQITDLVEFARNSVDHPGPPANVLWQAPLRRLYSLLVRPAESKGMLKGKRTLLVAPHAELHFLSFASLMPDVSGNRFLINRYQVTYTPSATAWVELGQRNARASANGVLALAPKVDRLPGSRSEVLAIRRIYGRRATVRIGSDATVIALRTALPNAGIVHLATFGVLNKHNPLFSFVELAPRGSDDGRLEVNEVFGLPLSGQLVILSACQTALASGASADVPPGDDWVGLVQAFLQSGAGAVLATLWPVEDRATGELMEQFHQRLVTGMPAPSALAEAQRKVLSNPATANPRYWAAFSISVLSQSQQN